MHRVSPAATCRVRIALGTLVAIEAHGASQRVREAAIGSAMACFQRVESAMHPTRPGSDLTALGAAQRGCVVAVDPWTVDVVRLAQRLQTASGGVFDPCLPGWPGRLSDLRLESDRELTPLRELRLDLGGIAKGFAVDRAVEALQAAGCSGGLINAGGDARAFGAVGFAIDCRLGAVTRRIELRDGAVAVSSADASSRPPEHRGYYCRAGEGPAPPPVLHHRHVAVLAASAALADALTKCVMLAPDAVSAALLQACNARSLPG